MTESSKMNKLTFQLLAGFGILYHLLDSLISWFSVLYKLFMMYCWLFVNVCERLNNKVFLSSDAGSK